MFSVPGFLFFANLLMMPSASAKSAKCLAMINDLWTGMGSDKFYFP